MSQDKIRPLMVAVADLPVQYLGLVLGVVNALRGSGANAVAKALKQALESVVKGNQMIEEKILRLISQGHDLSISECDGKNFLAKAKEVFKSFLDPDFTNWKLAQASHATKEVAVEVYDVVRDATFTQMFGSLGNDIDKLCFTQHQIEVFCQVNRNWLRADGYGTFFLFKENEQYFVANVRVYSDGLYVRVRHLESSNVWDAEYAHRLVVPQQTV